MGDAAGQPPDGLQPVRLAKPLFGLALLLDVRERADPLVDRAVGPEHGCRAGDEMRVPVPRPVPDPAPGLEEHPAGAGAMPGAIDLLAILRVQSVHPP